MQGKWNFLVMALAVMIGACYGGVMEDYESYADTAALLGEWTPTSTTTLSLDTLTYHGGEKAMRMAYDNSTSGYSIAKYTLPGVILGSTGKNLTQYSTLTVYFKVADASGYLQVVMNSTWGSTMAIFKYNNMNRTPVGDWVRWDIDLNSVPAGDLKHIGTIDLVVKEGEYTDWGSGVIYFDDLEFSTPLIKVVEWNLDGDTMDSSGLKNHAKTTGTLNYVPGVYGDCLEFSGVGNATVGLDDANGLPVGSGQAFSLNIWVNPAVDLSSGTTYHGLGLAGIGKHGWSYQGRARCIGNWGWGQGISFISTGVKASYSGVPYSKNKWQMITMTFDPELWANSSSNDTTGDSLKVYKDGELIQQCHPQGLYYDGVSFYSFENTPIVELLPIIADHNTDFSGKLDEFTVWRGVLTPEQITELMPYTSDFDGDHDVDIADLSVFASEWLVDNRTSAYQEVLLDDFESYSATGSAGQTGTLLDTWVEWPGGEWGGVTVLTLLTNAADAYQGSQAMRWNYDNTDPNPTYSSLVMQLSSTVNLSNYDELRVWLNRDANNLDEDLFFMKFILGEDVAAEAWVTHTAGSVYSPVGWSEWVIDLHNDLIYSGSDLGYTELADITAFDSIMFGCGNHSGVPQGGVGQVDFDELRLVNLPDCSGSPTADFNDDCISNLGDYTVLSEEWLKGVD